MRGKFTVILDPGEEPVMAGLLASYPDVRASIAEGRVDLRSDTRSRTGLELLWSSSRANEKLLREACEQRAASMEELMA